MTRATGPSTVLADLPLPLAQILLRAINHKNPQDLHHNAYYLGEATLKLAASARIGVYLTHCHTPGSPLTRRLEALVLPSTGQWVGFLREVSAALSNRSDRSLLPLAELHEGITTPAGRWEAVRTLTDTLVEMGVLSREDARQAVQKGPLGFFTMLVRYRNEVLGHGAQRKTAFYEKVGPLLLDAVVEVLRVPDLFGGLILAFPRLVAESGIESSLRWFQARGLAVLPHDGEAKQVAGAAAPTPGHLYFIHRTVCVPLHPLIIYLEDENEQDRFGFLNRTVRRVRRTDGEVVEDLRRVDFLDYATGDAVAGVDASRALAALLTQIRGETVRDSEMENLLTRNLKEEGQDEEELLPEGRLIGNFEILGELGRGGMGVVYRARQRTLNRIAALKVLPPVLAADPVAVGRFRREIKSLGAVDHRNVVKILTSGRDGDRYFYAMEFVEGADLARVFGVLSSWRRGGEDLSASHLPAAVRASSGDQDRMPPPADAAPEPPPPPPGLNGRGNYHRNLAGLFAQAADGVNELHENGIVHRDLKPGNFMVTADGRRLVVMDLGLAQVEGTQHALTRPDRSGILGTLRYAAPEQLLRGKVPVDHRADIYALGASLYELACMVPLYDADSEKRLTVQKLQEEPRPPARLDRTFPVDLATIIQKCLLRDPGERYASAAHLAEDLRAFCGELPISIKAPGFWKHLGMFVRHHRKAVAAALCVVLLIIVLTVFFMVNLATERNEARRGHATGYIQMARRLAEDGSFAQAQLAAAVARRVHDSARIRAGWQAIAGSPAFLVAARWRRWLEKAPDVEEMADLIPGHAGRRLYLVEERRRVHCLQLEDGKEVQSFLADGTGDIQCAASVSSGSTGRRLLLGTDTGAIEVWDVTDIQEGAPRCLHRHSAHQGRVWTLHVSEGNRRLYSLGEDHRVAVWRLPLETDSTPERMLDCGRTLDPPYSFAAASGGEKLVVGGMHGRVKVWILQGGGEKVCDAPVLGGLDRVMGVFWWRSPGDSGSMDIVTVGRSGKVLVWSVRERKDGLALEPEPAVAGALETVLQVVKSGDRLYLGGAEDRNGNARIRVINLRKRGLDTNLPGHTGQIRFLAAGRRGTALFSAATDGMLQAWDLDRGPSVWKRERAAEAQYPALLLLGDGRLAAAAGSRVDLYRSAGHGLDGPEAWTLFDAKTDIHELARCGGRVAAVDRKGRLYFIDPDTDRILKTMNTGRLRCLTGDPRQPRVFGLQPGGRKILEVDLEADTARALPAPDGAGTDWRAGALAHGGGALHAVGLHGEVYALQSTSSWNRVAPAIRSVRAANALAVQADGSLIAVGDGVGRLHVYDRKRKAYRTLEGFENYVTDVAFTRTGRGTHIFWTAKLDSRIGSWDPGQWESGDGVLLQTGHGESMSAFCMLQDGNRLVTASTDGSLRILDVDLLSRLPTSADLRRLEDDSGYFLDGFDFKPIRKDTPVHGEGFRSRWELNGHE